MKSVLLYTPSGEMVSVRRPIGFSRPLESSPARPEEWGANALENATGVLIGSECYSDWGRWGRQKK